MEGKRKKRVFQKGPTARSSALFSPWMEITCQVSLFSYCLTNRHTWLLTTRDGGSELKSAPRTLQNTVEPDGIWSQIFCGISQWNRRTVKPVVQNGTTPGILISTAKMLGHPPAFHMSVGREFRTD